MSKKIAELLGVNFDILNSELSALERASGNPGVDVRMTAELMELSRRKLRSLGLDPNDSTGEEVYYALQTLAQRHEKYLMNALHLRNQENTLQDEIISIVNKLSFPKKGWFIKNSATKQILRKQPPRLAMKALGYRSLESMLKREPVGSILATTQYYEGQKWKDDFTNKITELSTADFEWRIASVQHCRLRKMPANAQNIQKAPEALGIFIAGCVVIVSCEGRDTPLQPGGILLQLLNIFHGIAHIRTLSSFLLTKRMQSNFSGDFSRIVHKNQQPLFRISQSNVHWRVAQRRLTKSILDGDTPHSEEFLSYDDLVWRHSEDILYTIEPALHFWAESKYLGRIETDGRPLSFNLHDVTAGLTQRYSYQHRTSLYMQSALWDELMLRYMAANKSFDNLSVGIVTIDEDLLSSDNELGASFT
jgi:hypothetical protein